MSDPVPLTSGALLDSDPARPAASATVAFRDIIPPPGHPKIANIESHNARTWCDTRAAEIPPVAWLVRQLKKERILGEPGMPFKGFTANGEVEEGVYSYGDNEGAPVDKAAAAAEELLRALDNEQKKAVQKGPVELDDEFRIWSNPELYVNPGGLRLDETTHEVQKLVHTLLRASLSPAGYHKALGCTLTNEFLGHLVNGPAVLNRHSYNFRLFGSPSLDQPWGYSFFGHHLCLAVVFVGKRMVIGPTFMGAEPDRIDGGEHEGLRLFEEEEFGGLSFMQALPEEMQKQAQLFEDIEGTSLPKGRWNPYDERHVGGAFQDNRVVPYEGLPCRLLPPLLRPKLLSLISSFLAFYPSGPLRARMAQIEGHLDRTYFAWMGEFGDDDPYYFRIHSPAVFVEFDFHCGIFLTNTSPAKCHIHTITRLPNGGDYGKALIAQEKRAKSERDGQGDDHPE